MSYGVTRTQDQTGDVGWVSGRNTWERAESPVAERVRFVLATPRGECLVDPELGVDWRRVDLLRTDAVATAEASIRAALKGLVDAQEIRDVAVRVDVFPARGLIAYDVSFVDVKLKALRRVQGEA